MDIVLYRDTNSDAARGLSLSRFGKDLLSLAKQRWRQGQSRALLRSLTDAQLTDAGNDLSRVFTVPEMLAEARVKNVLMSMR